MKIQYRNHNHLCHNLMEKSMIFLLKLFSVAVIIKDTVLDVIIKDTF